jgi:hypothetical protein
MSEFFVIRTKDWQYVGPLGFTSVVDAAVFFPSRMAALAKCKELGSILDGAAIMPYSPAKAAASAETATDPKKRSGRLRTPWKAGK